MPMIPLRRQDRLDRPADPAMITGHEAVDDVQSLPEGLAAFPASSPSGGLLLLLTASFRVELPPLSPNIPIQEGGAHRQVAGTAVFGSDLPPATDRLPVIDVAIDDR
jgi:hypothetical protein